MSENTRSLRSSLAASMREVYKEPAEHPLLERWFAYHQGELPAVETEALQEHLVSCPDCFDLIQAIDAFQSVPEGAGVSEFEAEAGWRLLRPRLPGTSSVAVTREAERRRRGLPALVRSALAASLLAACGGLAIWNLSLQRALEETGRPWPNARILQFSTEERAETQDDSMVAGTGPLTLVFHPPVNASRRYRDYRLEIRENGPKATPWMEARDLRLDEDFALTVTLPRGLPLGEYRLELYGREDDGTWDTVLDHRLRVTGRRASR